MADYQIEGELICCYISQDTHNRLPGSTKSFLGGMVAGSIATAITYPFDLLRTRFALQGDHNRVSCAFEITQSNNEFLFPSSLTLPLAIYRYHTSYPPNIQHRRCTRLLRRTGPYCCSDHAIHGSSLCKL